MDIKIKNRWTGIPMSVKLVSSLGFYFVEKLPHIIALLEAGEKMEGALKRLKPYEESAHWWQRCKSALAAYEAARGADG